MLEFYVNGGFFMHAITLTAVGALGLNILLIRRADPASDLIWLAIALTAVTFLLGLLGTAFGLHQFSSAVVAQSLPPERLVEFLCSAIGIASITTAWGTLLASGNALLLGVVRIAAVQQRVTTTANDLTVT